MINTSFNHPFNNSNFSSLETTQNLGHPSSNWQLWVFLYSLALVFLCIIGFVFNTFIVVAVLLNRKLRSKVVYVFCCHLGCVGVLWSTVVLPYSVVTEMLQEGSKPSHWCDFIGVLRNILIQLSVWSIGLLSWDKYKAIVLPLHHFTSAKPCKTILTFCTFWLASISINILPIIFSDGYRYDNKTSYCKVTSINQSENNRFQLIYLLAWQLVTFYIPACLLLFCYVRIFIVARRQTKRIVVMTAMGRVIALSVGIPLAKEQANQHVTSRNTRASHTICRFLGAFMVSYFPYAIVQLVFVHVDEHNVTTAFFFLRFSGLLLAASPTINAFIYGVRNSVLQESSANYLRKKFGSKEDVYKDEKANKFQRWASIGLLNNNIHNNDQN